MGAVIIITAHYCAFLSPLFALPLVPLIESPPQLAAQSLTFQFKLQELCWLPSMLKSSPWYLPGIVTSKWRYCFLS